MPASSIMPKAEPLPLPAPAGVDAKASQGREDAPLVQQPEVGESHPADRAFHAALARFSGGLSPIALLLAYTDWLSHLATSPQRQLEISQAAMHDAMRLFEAPAAGQGRQGRPCPAAGASKSRMASCIAACEISSCRCGEV